MTATAAEGITPITMQAFHAMCGCLDGLEDEEARNAALNVLARVIMVQASVLPAAITMAELACSDICECIRANWQNILDERAKNGGQQPRVGSS